MILPGLEPRNPPVLVTGGTGFIGGRLTERLVLEYGVPVRVLVRRLERAWRVARLPVELVPGDVTVLDDVLRGASGCRVIFHCAYGNDGDSMARRTVNVQGTKNILEAALRNRITRVVHVSSAAVYGIPERDLDESAPRRYTGDAYADSKLDAENAVYDYVRRGVSATILQPTIVYGPFGTAWTTRILRNLKSGRQILVNGGDGLCNPVYVDDVVTAMVQAGVVADAAGEAFLISGNSPIAWRDFFSRFEQMLGSERTVSMSEAQARAHFFRSRSPKRLAREIVGILRQERGVRQRILATAEVSMAMGIARRVLPTGIRRKLRNIAVDGSASSVPREASGWSERILPLSPFWARFYAAKSRVRIEKARRVLGYAPAFDFDQGMALTKEWAEWANLLGTSQDGRGGVEDDRLRHGGAQPSQ